MNQICLIFATECNVYNCLTKHLGYWLAFSSSSNRISLHSLSIYPSASREASRSLLKDRKKSVLTQSQLGSSYKTAYSAFTPIPKKGNAKECSNYRTIVPILQASKVMLEILQARLQQYMNHELPDVQAGFRKVRGTRDQIANIRWIMEKAREFQKNMYFCFIDCAKAFDCVDHNKLWKILKAMGIPDHLICLLRNLYAGQEAAVRTGNGTTDWFQIGKGVRQGCILSPCLFNLYAEYNMTLDGLEETQAGIKIAGRNINNLRYADDTTLMAEKAMA